jgi:hypothetical protein
VTHTVRPTLDTCMLHHVFRRTESPYPLQSPRLTPSEASLYVTLKESIFSWKYIYNQPEHMTHSVSRITTQMMLPSTPAQAPDLYSGDAWFESCWDTDYTYWEFLWFSSVSPCKCWDSTSVRPLPLPSLSFPINYSSAIRTFDSI